MDADPGNRPRGGSLDRRAARPLRSAARPDRRPPRRRRPRVPDWTTIPQGIAKDLYFDAFRPGPIAKLEQSLAAVVLDARVPKERVLRLFLRTAYLGETPAGPVNGFAPAARAWMGEDVRDLDRREFLSLVAPR